MIGKNDSENLIKWPFFHNSIQEPDGTLPECLQVLVGTLRFLENNHAKDKNPFTPRFDLEDGTWHCWWSCDSISATEHGDW
ncbi:hypothetical protein VNO80_15096 [Phaseolus coccineus]|uniref:Uncharacterized protein n=1 Tax=Phaseolus coccineus TaxID=3886 RepID=A0AAN9R2M0_PHACN